MSHHENNLNQGSVDNLTHNLSLIKAMRVNDLGDVEKSLILTEFEIKLGNPSTPILLKPFHLILGGLQKEGANRSVSGSFYDFALFESKRFEKILDLIVNEMGSEGVAHIIDALMNHLEKRYRNI